MSALPSTVKKRVGEGPGTSARGARCASQSRKLTAPGRDAASGSCTETSRGAPRARVSVANGAIRASAR